MTGGITAGTVAAAASAVSAIYTIAQGSGKGSAPAVAAPVLEKPTVMPTPTDENKAKRASIAEQMRRRGRASTILTDLPDALGG